MRLDAGWLRRERRAVLRYAIAFGMIVPAVLVGAVSPTPAVDDVAYPPVRPAVEASAAERQEHARLDAVFARHYGIPLDLAARIHAAAREAGLDPVLAFGLVNTESSFRRTAVSWAGAVGYTQIMPGTARWMDPSARRVDLFDADRNLELGFEYLAFLLEYYEGDVRLALTAYNRGPGTVDALRARGRDPENGYADRVLGTDARSGGTLRS